MAPSERSPAISAGSALFRGALPPRPENLRGLERAGVTVTAKPTPEGAHWAARAVHPTWGKCDLVCLRNPTRVPDVLIKHDARLTDDEKRLVPLGQISPRSLNEASDLRAKKEEMAQFLRERRQKGADA